MSACVSRNWEKLQQISSQGTAEIWTQNIPKTSNIDLNFTQRLDYQIFLPWHQLWQCLQCLLARGYLQVTWRRILRCGSFCWNFLSVTSTQVLSPGLTMMANLSWLMQKRWLACGDWGRTRRTWTMTSWAEPCATTTTRISLRKYWARSLFTGENDSHWLVWDKIFIKELGTLPSFMCSNIKQRDLQQSRYLGSLFPLMLQF